METRLESFIARCFLNGETCNMREKLSVSQKDVFAVMPFKGRDTVAYALREAVEKSGLSYKRADQFHSNILIPCKVCQQIQSSRFIVGDISEYNPNVFFELGIAFAIGRTVKLIKDDDLNAPVDLAGIEYIGFSSSNIPALINSLQQWFQQAKSEVFQYDNYLLGHLLRVISMRLTLNNYNSGGDTTTRYEIEVQKIGVGQNEEDMFAMPYHDSVSVDVDEDFFALDARDEELRPMHLEHIVSSNRLKRFCIGLGNLQLEDSKKFSVELKEKQLFDKEESHDWYDINIVYPTEYLSISIKINSEWEIGQAWMSYGESLGRVKSELVQFEHDVHKITAVLKRPKVGVTYIVRWKWK